MQLMEWDIFFQETRNPKFPFGPNFTYLVHRVISRIPTEDRYTVEVHVSDSPHELRLGWLFMWKEGYHVRETNHVRVIMRIADWKKDGESVGLNTADMGLETDEGRLAVCQLVQMYVRKQGNPICEIPVSRD